MASINLYRNFFGMKFLLQREQFPEIIEYAGCVYVTECYFLNTTQWWYLTMSKYFETSLFLCLFHITTFTFNFSHFKCASVSSHSVAVSALCCCCCSLRVACNGYRHDVFFVWGFIFPNTCPDKCAMCKEQQTDTHTHRDMAVMLFASLSFSFIFDLCALLFLKAFVFSQREFACNVFIPKRHMSFFLLVHTQFTLCACCCCSGSCCCGFSLFSISPFYRCIAMHFKCMMNGNTMEEIGLFVFMLIFVFFFWCLCDKFTPYFRSMCLCVCVQLYLVFVLCRCSPFHFILKYFLCVCCLSAYPPNNQSKNGSIRKKAKPLLVSLLVVLSIHFD